MTEAGITVVRFSDREVLNNLDLVLEKKWKKIMINKISPNPSFPKRGREEAKNDPLDCTKTQNFNEDSYGMTV